MCSDCVKWAAVGKAAGAAVIRFGLHFLQAGSKDHNNNNNNKSVLFHIDIKSFHKHFVQTFHWRWTTWRYITLTRHLYDNNTILTWLHFSAGLRSMPIFYNRNTRFVEWVAIGFSFFIFLWGGVSMRYTVSNVLNVRILSGDPQIYWVIHIRQECTLVGCFITSGTIGDVIGGIRTLVVK